MSETKDTDASLLNRIKTLEKEVSDLRTLFKDHESNLYEILFGTTATDDDDDDDAASGGRATPPENNGGIVPDLKPKKQRATGAEIGDSNVKKIHEGMRLRERKESRILSKDWQEIGKVRKMAIKAQLGELRERVVSLETMISP